MAEPASSGTQALDRAVQLVVDGRPGRRAAVVRRPAGGDRAGQVHDLAAARRPRAGRPARARRRTAATSPAASSGCTPRGTTRGSSWSGWPARRWSGSVATPRRRVHLSVLRGDHVVQVAQVDSQLPARHPRLDPGRRPGPHLLPRQGLPGLGRARPRPARVWSGSRPRTLTTLAALERDGATTRTRGYAVTVDELEDGPHRCRRTGARGPRRRGRRARHLRSDQPARRTRRRARSQPDHPGGARSPRCCTDPPLV